LVVLIEQRRALVMAVRNNRAENRFSGLQQSRREFSFLDQVALNARPVAGGAGGQGERASLGCRRGLGAMRTFKMLFQPFQRLAEADPPQVHD